MSLSVIPTAVFLSPEVVKLGQFTVNLAQIHETNYYPDNGESPTSTIADFHYQGHRQDDKQTRFRAVLSSLISANLFRKSDYSIHIAPGHGNNYLLCDVDQWFNTTLDNDGAKRFIQSCAIRGDKIFMVVGMQTLIDPRITIASSTTTEAEGQFSVPKDISLAASVVSPAFQAGHQTAKNQGLEFVVPGERLFALLYRKVEFKWLKRYFGDRPVLDRTTRRWNCLGDTWRSIDDSSGSDDEDKSEDSDDESNIGDDAIEVTLGEELGVSDGGWVTAHSDNRLYVLPKT
ncbi:Ff.00g034540.m01.CDS01 [Fusarium sp. VM40]|nr:Ff.00g034540.m01.CDS01 [Fusarium sp. VM40]